MDHKDIFVFLEQDGDTLLDVGLEMLTPARKLAASYGGRACGILIGERGLEKAAQRAVSCGADAVYILSGAEYGAYSCDAFTAAMTALVQKYRPAALMIGSTVNGRDLAPRVACRLKTGLTADVTDVVFDEARGCIDWIMPTYGGQLMASIICPVKFPQMGTVRPGVFEIQTVREEAAEGAVIHEEFRFPAEEIRTELVKKIQKTAGGAGLREAEIVVAGGYGCRDQEGFRLVEQLAETLGAAVGASRAAIDAGWTTEDRQIGQSGVSVQPKLYIACGISGAAQHTAGMDRSGTIVAINTDPNAAIFKIADYGVKADIKAFLPSLIEALKAER